MRIRIALAFLLVSMLLAPAAEAALLYLDPAETTVRPGDTFPVNVRIDPQGECINAAEVNIGYPKGLLEVVDVSRGESIFPIWITAPTVKPEFGLLTMVGGVPGGYCGRTPGDPSLTNILAKLIVRVPSGVDLLPARVRLAFLPSSLIVLHDGRGTEARTVFENAQFTVSASGTPRANVWTDALANDKTAPEMFVIEVHREPSVLDNKYFAVFSTVDKQTGLDYYEVSETRDMTLDLVRDRSKLSFRRADSPYVLQDQDLRSIVRVRAVDKAGNERIAEYRLPEDQRGNRIFLWLFGTAAFFFIFLRVVRLFL